MTDAAAASAAAADRLKITEIFLSLQGEARDAGWPTVFVRLTGCPLRCQYCDTAYAFFGGEWRDIDGILAEVASHGVRHVCVTGGEPLAQKRCIDLLRRLCDAGHRVSLETSGAIDVSDVDPRVSRVLDIKTPGSSEVARNRWDHLPLLTARSSSSSAAAKTTTGHAASLPTIASPTAATCCFRPARAKSPRATSPIGSCTTGCR